MNVWPTLDTEDNDHGDRAAHRFVLQTASETASLWTCPACSRRLSYDREARRFRILDPGDAMVNHGAVSASAHVRLQMAAPEIPEPPRSLH
jgi:hypothetical protein